LHTFPRLLIALRPEDRIGLAPMVAPFVPILSRRSRCIVLKGQHCGVYLARIVRIGQPGIVPTIGAQVAVIETATHHTSKWVSVEVQIRRITVLI
jgi:hypothetical protein